MAKTKQQSKRGRRSAGISNRPLEEEQRSQARVPPAGTARGESEPVLRPRPGEHPPPRDPARKRRRARYPMPE